MLTLGLDLGSVTTRCVALDERGCPVLTLSRRKGPDDLAALGSFLGELGSLTGGRPLRLGVVGGEVQGERDGRMAALNALLAVAAGVRLSHPRARSVVEIGGHTAKFLVLTPEGRLRDFATNEACAAGTGSFLEQQARRLGLSAPELASLAAAAPRAATVAGRCSVFAASDMIHLQQKGTPLAEIAYGLCLAIARNDLSTLLKGRGAPPPVVIAGGCAHNRGLVRAFAEVFGLAGGDLLVSALPGLEGAVGAALAARAPDVPALGPGEAREAVASLFTRARRRSPSLRPLRPAARPLTLAEPAGEVAGEVDGYVGLDVGSVSTDLVVLDAAGNVLSSVYLPTRGRPAEALLSGLALLAERFGDRLTVLGCGATGSGRHLAGRLAGADVVKNEITCQLLGAQRYVPDVDTILEIGGQDSKFILVKDGAIAGFAMNKVCAAGTGSFLEEQARALGVDVRGEFASRALAAGMPPDLGTRCTVFMETEVASAVGAGEGVDEVCAGLAYSVVRNYLEKVVGPRPLGQNVVFQGGVASNGAVVSAFESVLARPVTVHPYNRISGAIGAALAAKEARERTGAVEVSRFLGFRRAAMPVVRSFECAHCANRCEVNILETGPSRADRAFFGDTCERYTSGAGGSACRVPNLADEYVTQCEALFAGGDESGLSIGVPRASSLMGALPFWATFWKELGHRPVLSAATSHETLALGLEHLSVGVCLPVKTTVGHVHTLLGQGVDRVFVPAVVVLPGDEPTRSYSCPYTMAVPFIVGAPDGERLLSPIVTFESEHGFAEGFAPIRELLGASSEGIRAAYRAAKWAQEELDALFRERVRKEMAGGGHRHVFGILGRPYTLFDPWLNLGLFERLRRLDVLAVPLGLLPLEDGRVARSHLPWRFPADVHEGAVALAAAEGIRPVVLSSFGCGPDAFAFRQVEETLADRAHLVLELDEHRGEAGLLTRIEAFLDQIERDGRPYRPPRAVPPESRNYVPTVPSRVLIPYFADHAHAFSGLFRMKGHDARVLPLPGEEARSLGEKHSLGKECHAFSMIAGDLLRVAREGDGIGTVFYFPGTSIPCLLHEYGRGMEALLRELGIEGIRVSSPSGGELVDAFGIDALDRLYVGILAIELLVKAACQTRPYELEKGVTDDVHRKNLLRIEEAVASGDIYEALASALQALGEVPVAAVRDRPVVGIAGDIYTKVNPAANDDLVRWLEEQGLEVWPSPFQIDLLDFGISRRLYQSVASLDRAGLLVNGAVALRRAVDVLRVWSVVGSRVARREEPGYLEMRKLAGPYMPNESHELLFVNVAKIVDFARGGADGVVNAICFGCMVGNASAAVIERIRRDFDDVPIVTAVYSGADDPSRRMVLDAFVSQVKAHAERRRAAAPASLGERLQRLAGLSW
jgi:predicted CoA-substrate-specific enzyme activase